MENYLQIPHIRHRVANTLWLFARKNWFPFGVGLGCWITFGDIAKEFPHTYIKGQPFFNTHKVPKN
jgi:hypothetical protein